MKLRRIIKVVYVVCYRDPNYIRTTTLISALNKIDSIDLIVVKNKQKGFLRYLEVPIKLLWTRINQKPDVFFVGFRGHEAFWLLYPSMVGKRIVFDEFINLHDWLVSEHGKLKEKSFSIRLLDAYVKWIYRRSWLILTDTEAHASLSSYIYDANLNKIKAVPVGADEKTFYQQKPTISKSSKFEIFFYGNMLPLHGMEVILGAIKLLAEKKQLGTIHLTMAGGRGNAEMLKRIEDFIAANKLKGLITHLDWVPYNELPNYIAKADLCLGGPFGDTGQARRVITGKTYQFLAMGKPTLIGKIESLYSLKNKYNCLIVEQGSTQALADMIYWAERNRMKLKRIGRNGRSLYEEQFSVNKISEILIGILSTI